MFTTAHFQGEIVHRDSECIIISLYSPPPKERSYKGQLVYCIKTNRFTYNIMGFKNLPEFKNELSEGLSDLMVELRSIGIYPGK